MQIGSRGILAPQGPPNVHDSLFIDGFLKSEWLVRGLLLPPPDGLLKALGWAVSNIFGKPSSLVGIGENVTFVSLSGQFGRGVRVVSSEDLVSPFGVLQLLSLLVRDQDWCLRFLTLSVIELHSGVLFRIGDLHARLLQAVLTHGSHVSELHVGVVTILGHLVALSAEVNIRQAALMLSLFPHVHL